jgi:hypothetical protein
MRRYAIVNNETIVGVVNWDGAEAHPYGAVELRGPLPEGEGLETWDGRPAADIPLRGTTDPGSNSREAEARAGETDTLAQFDDGKNGPRGGRASKRRPGRPAKMSTTQRQTLSRSDSSSPAPRANARGILPRRGEG